MRWSRHILLILSGVGSEILLVSAELILMFGGFNYLSDDVGWP